MILLGICAAVFCALGITLVFLGWKALIQTRTLLALPTTPIADLKAGPVEVCGVIRAKDDGAELRSGFGTSSVIVQRIVENRVGKHYHERESERRNLVKAATIADNTGECDVSLEHVFFSGEVWEHFVGNTRTTEVVVPHGANVIISAVAVETLGSVDGGYRGGTRLMLAGTADKPLVISVGGQRSAVWRFGWRPLLCTLCGIALVALGSFAAWLRIVL